MEHQDQVQQQDQQQQAQQPQQQDHAQDKQQSRADSDKRKEIMIPKSRFDEVNEKYKQVQKQLEALLAEREEAEKKAKEEQGKFEELYRSTSEELDKFKTQYKKASDRVKQLEAVINSLLEAKLEGIDKEFHDLIPQNLTPEEKLDWLTKAEQKGLFKRKTEITIGEQTNPSQNQTVQDLSKLSPIQMLRMAYGQKL